MAFTPFHFGPAVFLKSLINSRFSFAAFAATQVVIDCETLYYLNKGEYPYHRVLHTFAGAGLIGLAVAWVSILIWRFVFALWPQLERWFSSRNLLRAETSTVGVFVGGLLGGLTHPLFDGMMHPDVRPFAPFNDGNPWLGIVDFEQLMLGCVVLGIAGLAILMVRSSRDTGPRP